MDHIAPVVHNSRSKHSHLGDSGCGASCSGIPFFSKLHQRSRLGQSLPHSPRRPYPVGNFREGVPGKFQLIVLQKFSEFRERPGKEAFRVWGALLAPSIGG